METDTCDYDAFGNLIARTGTTVNPFLFTGQRFDADSGLYHLRARYYQPGSGRFTAIDPFEGNIEAPASLHRYTYSANDPVNKFDPSGEETLIQLNEVQAEMAQIGRNQISSGRNYKVIFDKVGCMVIEEAIGKVVEHGIYIAIEAMTDGTFKPYVGQTKNEFEDRFIQHVKKYAKDAARDIQKLLVKFHVVGGKDELQLTEQLIMDFVSGGEKGVISNTNRAISPTRPSKAALRERLAKLTKGVCK